MDITQIVIVFLGLVFASIIIQNYNNTTYMYAFAPILEKFQDNYSARSGSPIENGSDSYLLLKDTLQGRPGNTIADGPNSQQCFQIDWSRNQERAGSYAQGTNNFKHNYPDSCSAWNHDLVLDFYKV